MLVDMLVDGGAGAIMLTYFAAWSEIIVTEGKLRKWSQ